MHTRRPAVVVVLLLNVVAVVVMFHLQRRALLDIVIDPTAPDVPAMRDAMTGYALHAAALVALVLLLVYVGLDRLRSRRPWAGSSWSPEAIVVVGVSALAIFTFVDGRVFADYGVHTYDFGVWSVVSNTMIAHDLGIHPVDIVIAVGGGACIVAIEVALLLASIRAVPPRVGEHRARWRAGGWALLVGADAIGLFGYANGVRGVSAANRSEFAEVLPYRHVMLLAPRHRPFIDVTPRLGAAGYPVVGANGAQAPVLGRKTNIVMFVTDGFRADLAHELATRMNAFATRPDVIAPRRFYTSGHTTDAGVFGMFYGVDGYDFFPFLQARVPSYPLDVLRANGYVTKLIAGSRLTPHPTDQLTRIFDDVSYPDTDDEVMRDLADFLAERRADHRPYLVMAFFYTTHWPFNSVRAPNARFTPALVEADRSVFHAMDDSAFRRAVLNSARNSVLQADENFEHVFEMIRPDYEAGRTAFVVTSDHGTDMWEHGSFGHGRSSFWNGKFAVPFMLALPGDTIPASRRTPPLASQLDLWPTLFDALHAEPRPAPERYSDGLSLLTADSAALANRALFLAGRFFPWADRPNAIVVGDRKYWFTTRHPSGDSLAFDVIRSTDLEDRPVVATPRADSTRAAAFADLRRRFWRFITVR